MRLMAALPILLLLTIVFPPTRYRAADGTQVVDLVFTSLTPTEAPPGAALAETAYLPSPIRTLEPAVITAALNPGNDVFINLSWSFVSSIANCTASVLAFAVSRYSALLRTCTSLSGCRFTPALFDSHFALLFRCDRQRNRILSP